MKVVTASVADTHVEPTTCADAEEAGSCRLPSLLFADEGETAGDDSDQYTEVPDVRDIERDTQCSEFYITCAPTSFIQNLQLHACPEVLLGPETSGRRGDQIDRTDRG